MARLGQENKYLATATRTETLYSLDGLLMSKQSLKLFFSRISYYAVTVIAVLIAIFIVCWLWIYYQVDPWTRDGRLRADVVKKASDVSGLITEIYVRDNQRVKQGQKLFAIDPERYRFALDEAEAKVASARAAFVESKQEDVRNRKLGMLASQELSEQTLSRTDQLSASLNQAISNRDTARLNLQRTIVTASVNGVVTNFELQPGDYAIKGEQAFGVSGYRYLKSGRVFRRNEVA